MTGHTPFSNLVKQMSKQSQKRAEKEREDLQKKHIRSVTLEFPSRDKKYERAKDIALHGIHWEFEDIDTSSNN